MSKKHYSSPTKLIILDWDGVAYPYTLTFLRDSLKAIISHVVEEKHSELSPEAAKEKENELYNRTVGYAVTHMDFAGFFKKNYNMEEEEVLAEIRRRAKDLSFLKPSEDIRREIERTQSLGVKVVVLSQSNTEWLAAGVARLGLSDLLQEDALFGIDKTKHNKHDGTDAYQYVLDRTGFTADQTLTVDDSSKNLKQAHKLGIETAYIPKIWKLHALHPFYPGGTKHSHPNLLEFLTEFNNDMEKTLRKSTGSDASDWQGTIKNRKKAGQGAVR